MANQAEIFRTLTESLSVGSGSTGWAATGGVITGQATNLGNKGTITYNVLDVITAGSPVVKSTSVAVDVPSSAGAATDLATTGGLVVTTATLNETYAATTYAYTATVPNTTASVTVTPTLPAGSTAGIECQVKLTHFFI